MLLTHLTLFAYLENDEDVYKVIASIGAIALFLLNCGSLYVSSRRKGVQKLLKPRCSTFGMVLTIGVLWVAGLASVGFGVLVWPARERLASARTVVAGSVMLSIQCMWLDAIYWVVNFGW